MKTLGFLTILWTILPLSAFADEAPKNSPKAIEEPTGAITLSQAVALALTRNPELQSFSLEIRAREANALQAGLLPNPDLDVEVENAAGSGNFNGFTQSETTVQLSQLIELGSKRALRAAATSLSKDLAGWDYEAKRVDVLVQVSKTFTEVLGAQKKLDLMRDLMSLAKKVRSTVSERVKAGKVSPIEEIKAGVALSSTRIELKRAKKELETARKRLGATWGNNNPKFQTAQGNLLEISPIPSPESLVKHISNNPDLARWSTEIAQRQAVIDREKSNSIPSITLSGGYRRLGETDDNAFIFGVSIPLMFFNRNQGAIRASLHQLAKAESDKRTAEVRINSALTEAFQALAIAHTEAEALNTQVLPGAQKAFDAINEGYRFGKFGFLDVLDSQRTLFQSKVQFLNALTAYHKAVADVERLIGGKLNPEPVTETK
ncbi:transporter [Candidatus Nitromaritima sp. SCGC AAA799-C22]|nr:transporter [Candidatus Nitromaritima sp. SCGC AAA799-C22]